MVLFGLKKGGNTMLKFSNQGGFPLLESTGVTNNGTTSTTISFNPHRFISNRFYGGFWVKVAQEVTGSNPIFFNIVGVPNSNIAVYNNNGTQLTATDLAGTGGQIYLFFYDRDSNKTILIA